MDREKDDTLTWGEEQEFLESVVDALFSDLKSYLEHGEYQIVDEFLQVADVSDSDEAVLVTILGATLSHKTELPSRESFFARTYARVRERLSERDANKLLEGFK